jgi:hypothetical protein
MKTYRLVVLAEYGFDGAKWRDIVGLESSLEALYQSLFVMEPYSEVHLVAAESGRDIADEAVASGRKVA